MNKFSRFFTRVCVAAGALLPALSMAEGETPAYSTAATQVQSELTTFLTNIKTPYIAIIVLGLGIWLIPVAVRLIKRGFGLGKGR